MKTLVIYGAGGHGKVVADTALETRIWERIVFVDDKFPTKTSVNDWQIVAKNFDELPESYSGQDLVIAIGNNRIRTKLGLKALANGLNLVSVIHPKAFVSSRAHIGRGSVVFANAIVNIGASIGDSCIINSGAIVEHDCLIKDGSHVCPGASLAGDVKIGHATFVGVGSSIKNGLKIGDDVIIGSGANVVSDIPDQKTVVGNPAKYVK